MSAGAIAQPFLMVVHPADKALPAVQVEAVRPQLGGAEADALGHGVRIAGSGDLHGHGVEPWILGRPALDLPEVECLRLVLRAKHLDARDDPAGLGVGLEAHAVRAVRDGVDADPVCLNEPDGPIQPAANRIVGADRRDVSVPEVVDRDLEDIVVVDDIRRQLGAKGRERPLVLSDAHAVEDDLRRDACAFATHEPAATGFRTFAEFAAVGHGLARIADALDRIMPPEPVVFNMRRHLPRAVATVLGVPRMRYCHRTAVNRPIDKAAHNAPLSATGLVGPKRS